jgi:hypothetical protein
MNRQELLQAREQDRKTLADIRALVSRKLHGDAMTLAVQMRTADMRGRALAVILPPMQK